VNHVSLTNQAIFNFPVLLLFNIRQKHHLFSCQIGDDFALLKQNAIAGKGADFVVACEYADQV
jgi:hypothetical protein